MYCKNCGNIIDDDVRFCTKCGIQISNNESTKEDDSLYVVHEFHYSNYGKEYEERMREKRSIKFLKYKLTISMVLVFLALIFFLIGPDDSLFYIYGILSVVFIIVIWILPILIKK